MLNRAQKQSGQWLREVFPATASLPGCGSELLDEQERLPAPGVQNLHPQAMSIYQFVSSSLEGGPRGIHPPTFVAALAAIAGYSANRAVAARIARGEAPDDFKLLRLRSGAIMVSEQVNRLVLAIDRPSIANITISAAMRIGLPSIPDLNALLQTHLLETRIERSVTPRSRMKHQPDIPPTTLLMMYWENLARVFRTSSEELETAPLAAAMAAGEALSIYRGSLPVEAGLDIILETAIALSKSGRAF